MNKQAEYQATWRKKNPNYQKIYNRQHTLVVGGKRIVVNKRTRPDTCEVCEMVGDYTGDRLSYHHWNDSNPHLGLWLCFMCHRMAEGVDRGLYTIYLKKKAEVNI